MISDFLEIFSNLSNLPDKQSGRETSRKNFLIFICCIFSTVCFVFIIPELKDIIGKEKAAFILISIILLSLCFSVAGYKLMKNLKIIGQQTFSAFLFSILTIFLICMLLMCSTYNRY
jgi:uncharacterized membrane protein YhaH (DUF805 family)